MNNENKLRNQSILFLTLRSDQGGGPKHLWDLSSLLFQRSIFKNIYIASPSHDPFGQKYKDLIGENNFIELSHRAFSFFTLIKLMNFINIHNIKIIHSHGRGAGIYSKFIKLILRKKILVIHTFHGVHFEGFIGKIKIYFEKILKHYTDRYICVSKDEETEALKYKLVNQFNSTIIFNGIDLTNFKFKNILDSSLIFLQKDKIILGTLTRNDPVKGINNLLLHFDKIIEKNPSLYFLIAGQGFNDGLIENRHSCLKYKNHLQFVGFQQAESFFNQIDVYFSVSKKEGLPLSVLEAMKFSKPIFLSNVSGHHYFLENNFASDFYQCINDLKDNIKTYRAEDVEFFSLDRQIHQTVELYNELLNAYRIS